MLGLPKTTEMSKQLPKKAIYTKFQMNTAAKEKIENYFHTINGHIVTTPDSAVAIFYAHSLVIPTDDAALKKIEIHLTIKEWKVK